MVYSAGKTPTTRKYICRLCFQDPATVTPVKLYNRKKIVTMEISIAEFHTSFYIKEIQSLTFNLPHVKNIETIKKLVFYLPHICILGTNNFGNTRRESFKHLRAKKYMLFHRDYAERVVASFAHQI